MTISNPQRVLVLGASGLLGNAMVRVLACSPSLSVVGTVRGAAVVARLHGVANVRLLDGVNVDRFDDLQAVFDQVRPDVVVNCIGATKHVDSGNDSAAAYLVNAVLPHSLAAFCATIGARLVHVSTDCVFAGSRGMYLESDAPDATDVYGCSKAAGEVCYRHTITIRTSIIGHEIDTCRSLVEWFMRQTECKGFRRAVFSGFPTVSLARIIRDVVLPAPSLHGLYQIAAAPINKLELLTLIARRYSMPTRIIPDDALVIDRSLDGSRFAQATGFQAPSWEELVDEMHADWAAHPMLYCGPGGAAR
jgi:dTDP-4-dehydrorhamnose reductase